MEVKKYLPFAYKKTIVEAVVEICVHEKDHVYYVDVMEKEFWTNKFILEAYSDVVFVEEVSTLEQYDDYMETGVVRDVIDAIGNEYYILIEAIDAAIEAKMKSVNTVEGVIGRIGSKLIAIIEEFTQGISPEKVDEMKQYIEKFDFKKLTVLSEMLGDKGAKTTNKQRSRTNTTAKKSN